MADTLTIQLHWLQAVLQECPGISPLERDGIVARLRSHNVAPEVALVTRSELTTTYVLVNFTEIWHTLPPPTAKNAFKQILWSGEPLLPYELQQEITIPHLVVVTANVHDALDFFELLMAQKGLTITALEFLIHGYSYDESYGLYYIQNDLYGTFLEKWAGDSKSIKILTEPTWINYELDRHMRFVVENGSLRNLRGISDQDRAPVTCPLRAHQNEANYGNRRGRGNRRRSNGNRRSRSRSPLDSDYSDLY